MSEVRIVMTCRAMPEQYDVFRDGEQVGYLRLRHRYFAAYRVVDGEIDFDGAPVYDADTIGDGEFDEWERWRHISEALGALLGGAA